MFWLITGTYDNRDTLRQARVASECSNRGMTDANKPEYCVLLIDKSEA